MLFLFAALLSCFFFLIKGGVHYNVHLPHTLSISPVHNWSRNYHPERIPVTAPAEDPNAQTCQQIILHYLIFKLRGNPPPFTDVGRGHSKVTAKGSHSWSTRAISDLAEAPVRVGQAALGSGWQCASSTLPSVCSLCVCTPEQPD